MNDSRLRSVLLPVLLLLTPLRGAETVRVDASSGAPRILVDGKPVRARIFWGAPGSRPLHVGAMGQEISFDFSPRQDEPSIATMHFRFGSAPGDVYLDDIHIVEANTGRDVLPTCDFEGGQESFARSWKTWSPPDEHSGSSAKVEPVVGRDGSAGLHVSIRPGPDPARPTGFHIYHDANLSLLKSHRYRVTFWAKAEPARDLIIGFYRPGKTYVDLGGPPSVFEHEISLAASAGVNLVSFPIHLPWPRPGEAPDWSIADDLCQTVLKTNPDALMIARIDVNPPEWMGSHASDAMVWDKGEHKQVKAVVASLDFRREAAEHLAELVRHMEEKFGPHMAGYHPAGQNTDEWFYQDTWLAGLNGYSKAEQDAWQHWLAKRYADDKTLQTAWHDPSVMLQSVHVPSPQGRRAASGVFHDPVAEYSLIDFAQFQQEMMADCVCTLAKAVREASQGRKLVFFSTAMSSSLARSAMARLLRVIMPCGACSIARTSTCSVLPSPISTAAWAKAPRQ
jgi:beta-galactosidase